MYSVSNFSPWSEKKDPKSMQKLTYRNDLISDSILDFIFLQIKDIVKLNKINV